MVPIRKLLLLGALLALTACGRPAPPTPIEVPIGGGPTTGGTSPAKPTEPAPAQPTPAPSTPGQRIELAQGKSATIPVERGGQTLTVKAGLSPEALTISGLPGAPVALRNPFGEQAEATLEPFRVQGEPHLLATLTNGRNVLVWVLVPGEQETAIALQTQVDWGAAIDGERVKLSWRKYKDDGGFYIVSEHYQFSPRTRQYQKAPA
ncbi:MAG TPA: hypothetical protein VK191_08640 [Symbiobacteriaceae bacterium]|nr:hypothetical protein [Symbiobacteriaceae bacterium]